MPFYINDELFLEDITLTQEQFYDYLAQGADVKTSQPAPGGSVSTCAGAASTRWPSPTTTA